MSDLLKFFLPCPRSVLLLPVAWPAAECPVCFLLRSVARIHIFLLQLMFVCCWKLQLCFLMQCTEGSPAFFWSKTSKLPVQWGILLRVPPPPSAMVMDSRALTGIFWCSLLPPAPLPTADPPEWPCAGLSYDVDPCQGWIPDGHLPTAGLRVCFTQD